MVSPKRVEIINLSVPGYNTAIELEVIEKRAFKYHPDLIILGYTGNDLDLPNYIRRKVYVPSYLYFFLKTALGMVIESIRDKKAKGPTSLLIEAPADEVNLKRYANVNNIGVVPPEYRYMIGVTNYLSSMKYIANITQKVEIPVLLISYDYALQNKSEVLTYGFHTLIMDRVLNQYLKDHNLTGSDIVLSAQDPHLNELGHRLYAQYLYEFIMADEKLKNIFQ